MKIEIYQLQPGQIKSLISQHLGDTLTVDQVEKLAYAANVSEPTLIAMWGETLLGIFGLVPTTLLSDHAYLWLYATPAVADHKIKFARKSREVVKRMLEVYPVITGHCLSHDAMIWVQWAGADFHYPVNGVVPFEFRRE
jgi:hypothetical protein